MAQTLGWRAKQWDGGHLFSSELGLHSLGLGLYERTDLHTECKGRSQICRKREKKSRDSIVPKNIEGVYGVKY